MCINNIPLQIKRNDVFRKPTKYKLLVRMQAEYGN